MPGAGLQGFELDPDHWESEKYVRQVGVLGQWEATGRAAFWADPRNAAAAAASLNRPDRAVPSLRRLQQKQPKRDRYVHSKLKGSTPVWFGAEICQNCLGELPWFAMEFIMLDTWHTCQV